MSGAAGQRQDGFYWVRQGDELMVAEYDDDRWYLPHSDVGFYDDDFNAIGERLEPPAGL